MGDCDGRSFSGRDERLTARDGLSAVVLDGAFRDRCDTVIDGQSSLKFKVQLCGVAMANMNPRVDAHSPVRWVELAFSGWTGRGPVI